MAIWRKLISYKSTTEMYKMISANSKSGYMSTGLNGVKYYWNRPASYYGLERNYRTNHSVGAEENQGQGGALADHLPLLYPYSAPWDGYVPYDCIIQAGHVTRIHWGVNANNFPDDVFCRYFFALAFVEPTDNKFWSEHNGQSMSLASGDITFPLNGYDGTSDTAGILKFDVNSSSYTANDTTYHFYFDYTHSGTPITLKRGSYYTWFVTNDTDTTSNTSEYMRDLTIMQEWERT